MKTVYTVHVSHTLRTVFVHCPAFMQLLCASNAIFLTNMEDSFMLHPSHYTRNIHLYAYIMWRETPPMPACVGPMCFVCGHEHEQGVRCSICGHTGKANAYKKIRVCSPCKYTFSQRRTLTLCAMPYRFRCAPS